jgi:hypothetical protein
MSFSLFPFLFTCEHLKKVNVVNVLEGKSILKKEKQQKNVISCNEQAVGKKIHYFN